LKVRFLRTANREFNEAVHYYNAQKVGLGEDFRHEVRETVLRIKEFPLAWHRLNETIRRCQLRRFPYGLIYSNSEL
jgi:toxin ParE2